jgi:hypothetical protein
MEVSDHVHALAMLPLAKWPLYPLYTGELVNFGTIFNLVAKRKVIIPAGNHTMVMQPVAGHLLNELSWFDNRSCDFAILLALCYQMNRVHSENKMYQGLRADVFRTNK